MNGNKGCALRGGRDGDGISLLRKGWRKAEGLTTNPL